MDANPRILLVDDDDSITLMLTTFLKLSGFEVDIAHNGEQALAYLNKNRPALIVLDVLMPGLDGREILRRLRRAGNWTPVILMTQVTGTPERIMALDEGADDYLNKPFDPQELAVRIRAVLRRAQPGVRSLGAARRLKSDRLSLDRTSRRVFLGSGEVPVTPKAAAILEYLMLHPDELVSRERLLDAVWGWESAVGMRVVDTRIAELRKALGDDPADPHYIETVPGMGYRFVGAVTEG
jgi:DNA-binding response OmpR family regulator